MIGARGIEESDGEDRVVRGVGGSHSRSPFAFPLKERSSTVETRPELDGETIIAP